MRRLSRTAVAVWSSVLVGGCAAITGLDQIQESECAPNCDAGTVDAIFDRTVDAPPMGDDARLDAAPDTTGDDTEPPEASSDDSSTGNDASDGRTSDGPAADAPSDAGVDAPFDSGCGPLNTVNNCSACGDKCASPGTSQTSATCSGPVNGAGATCSYTCAPGYLDCNASLSPPDLDGCECHSPGATQANCGANGCCPVQHNNGLGQSNSTFYDCVVAGTYNSTLAKDACVSFVGQANAAQCTQGQCVGPDGGTNGDLVWCSSGSATDCVCWDYTGPDVGFVHDQGAAGMTNCFCPAKGFDPSYN